MFIKQETFNRKGEGVMLIEKISNPWMKFNVIYKDLEQDKKFELAKEAFLFVIRTFNAYGYNKLVMLEKIESICPSVALIEPQLLFNTFQDLVSFEMRSEHIVTTAELKWIKKYIKDASLYIESEKMIYAVLLRASSQWDQVRHDFEWLISPHEKMEIASKSLETAIGIGICRKIEIVKEFDLVYSEFEINFYVESLLYSRKYDEVEKMGIKDDKVFLGVIISNINNGYINDALEVVRRFLPDREDLIKEIKQIKASLK